jgi:hypothetical protein
MMRDDLGYSEKSIACPTFLPFTLKLYLVAMQLAAAILLLKSHEIVAKKNKLGTN